jgi:biofilm PGA synthesis N-glycosyltransferase PgaC
MVGDPRRSVRTTEGPISHSTYVLITPARNEAQFIEQTIKSVVDQTIRPAKWIIVSDGSTDGTDDIVRQYTAEHQWIELVRMPERRERHFAGKVQAFNAGYARIKGLKYDMIGSLDADISFDANYFSFLLRKLAEDPALGLVGTPFKGSSTYDYRFVSIEHVSGACQLFRRECFEEIGGYVPVKGGGVDHIAVIAARMKGWRTRTFTDKVCVHHREIGSAKYGTLMAKFKVGVQDYALGSHPTWELFRTVYQMTKKPFVAGGLLLFAGYVWALIQRMERPISREMVAFRRREQMRRLRRLLTGNRILRNEAQSETKPSVSAGPAPASAHGSVETTHAGLLIVNADDWGRDHNTTQRALECFIRGTVSSVSAMVFMEDSERAAAMAREREIDAGLHINLTTPFSAPKCPARLIECQNELARYLLRHPLARVMFHPGLVRSFEYVVTAQRDEFLRLYGVAPQRLDGHHHMHLCSNVLLARLLPPGTVVRRNFSFRPGEKTLCNRLYRHGVDRILAQRHRLVDFFFTLQPLDLPGRVQKIFALAREFTVEVETHPINEEEYRFLARGEIFRLAGDLRIAPRFTVPQQGYGFSRSRFAQVDSSNK